MRQREWRMRCSVSLLNNSMRSLSVLSPCFDLMWWSSSLSLREKPDYSAQRISMHQCMCSSRRSWGHWHRQDDVNLTNVPSVLCNEQQELTLTWSNEIYWLGLLMTAIQSYLMILSKVTYRALFLCTVCLFIFLLFKKVLYWHRWSHEETLTFMEPFHWTKGSL